MIAGGYDSNHTSFVYLIVLLGNPQQGHGENQNLLRVISSAVVKFCGGVSVEWHSYFWVYF